MTKYIKDYQSLNPLKHIGSDYYKKNLFKEVEEEVEYSPGMLAIGRRIRNGREAGIYYLDLREACRIIGIGATRSGKTWVCRRFVDTIVQAGNSAIYLFDVKDEMKSSAQPLQSKFHHLLMEHEKPTPTKVVTLRPTFFKQFAPSDSTAKELNEFKKENNYWYSIDINKLSERDFNDLLQVGTMGETQQSVMHDLYEETRKVVSKGGVFSFDYLFAKLEAMDDISQKQKDSLKRRLKPIIMSHFYEKDNEVDIVELIKDGFIPAINMEDFDRFGKDGIPYHISFLSIVHRELVNAKRKGLIPKIWFVLDEAGRVVANDMKNAFQFDIVDSFELNARYDINYLVLTQFLKSLPERIIKNARYIFIPASADLETFKDCLRELGLFRNQQSLNNEASSLKRKMSIKSHHWLILDRMSGTREIVSFFAPLSNHAETGS